MIIFVDYEHADGRKAKWGSKLMALRTIITYRLEDLSGQHCMLVRYDRITPELLSDVGATAIFISGNGSAPDIYDPEALKPLQQIVRSGELPIFGFCGGFQFLSQALGAELMPINADVPQEHEHLLQPFGSGRLGEMGYHPVDIVSEHPMLEGLGDAPVFRHAHYLEVPEPADGFEVLASSPVTKVQMAVHNERRIVGTQFHPESYTDEFPAGEQLIKNFMRWADIRPNAS